jgi:hypothetical protein
VLTHLPSSNIQITPAVAMIPAAQVHVFGVISMLSFISFFYRLILHVRETKRPPLLPPIRRSHPKTQAPLPLVLVLVLALALSLVTLAPSLHPFWLQLRLPVLVLLPVLPRPLLLLLLRLWDPLLPSLQLSFRMTLGIQPSLREPPQLFFLCLQTLLILATPMKL